MAVIFNTCSKSCKQAISYRPIRLVNHDAPSIGGQSLPSPRRCRAFVRDAAGARLSVGVHWISRRRRRVGRILLLATVHEDDCRLWRFWTDGSGMRLPGSQKW